MDLQIPIAEDSSFRPAPVAYPPNMNLVREKYDAIEAGGSFWDVVYEPFMSRDLTRADVKEIIQKGLTRTLGSYKILTREFHMPESDYKKFLNFLYKNKCHVSCMEYRQPQLREAV